MNTDIIIALDPYGHHHLISPIPDRTRICSAALNVLCKDTARTVGSLVTLKFAEFPLKYYLSSYNIENDTFTADLIGGEA